MKLLYITPSLSNSGGIARVIALKANYFTAVLGYEVHIISVGTNSEHLFYNFDKNIQWHDVKKISNPILVFKNYVKQIQSVVIENKIDRIIVCDADYWLFLPWIFNLKIPMFFETHVSKSLKKEIEAGVFNRIKNSAINVIKTQSLQKFKSVIFETEQGSNEWNIKNKTIIANPLPFTSQEKATLLNKRVINVSRHSQEKGLDILLHIWKQIIKIHPDWQLDIYGEWNDLKYQNLASELGISTKVNFFLPVVNIKEKYLESSIYAMTSRSEAFGMVLIEAMECGLPCLAFDCPVGPKAIINNNENGFLIEDGNEIDFVNTIITLIENEKVRLKIGENAKISSQKYNIDLVMQIWQNLLKN